jgi:hypothetical protein
VELTHHLTDDDDDEGTRARLDASRGFLLLRRSATPAPRACCCRVAGRLAIYLMRAAAYDQADSLRA